MNAEAISKDERLRRRIALVHQFGIGPLRSTYQAAVAKSLDRPIACVFQVSSGGGFNALKALGRTANEDAIVLPIGDVIQVATACQMFDLLDVLNRYVPGRFSVLCMAWDGWSLFYPDEPAGMEPSSYRRSDESEGGSSPPSSAPAN